MTLYERVELRVAFEQLEAQVTAQRARLIAINAELDALAARVQAAIDACKAAQQGLLERIDALKQCSTVVE